MKTIYFFLAFILVFITRSQAQQLNGNIQGRIVDEQKKPVHSVTVTLKGSKDSSVYKTTQTGKDGLFAFSNIISGVYYLEISAVGFKNIIKRDLVILDSMPRLLIGDLEITLSSKTLSEVTVTSRPPVIERKLDRVTINVENSILNAGTSVLEALAKIPGVKVSSDGSISLNGKSGVNILIDGKPSYLSGEDMASLLQGMPSSDLQKIEIMTNPPAKYDAAGNRGVINIIKKKNKKSGFNGTVNGGIGWAKYGRYNAGVNLNYKNRYVNVSLNLSYLNTKSYYTRRITSDIFNSNNSLASQQLTFNRYTDASKSYTPSVGIDFYLSQNNTLSLTASGGIRTPNNQIVSYLDTKDENKKQMSSIDFRNYFKDQPKYYNWNLHWEHKFDTTRKELTVDLDNSNYDNNMQQSMYNDLYNADGAFLKDSNVYVYQNRALNIYAARADYSQPLKGNARFECGLKSSYVTTKNNDRYFYEVAGLQAFDSTRSSFSTMGENINALYVNFLKEYKRLSFQTGLRAEHTNGRATQFGNEIRQNYISLFPTLFVDYNIDKNSKLNLKASKRIQRVSYSQLNPFRSPKSSVNFFQGNPNLKPQISINGELTYSYKSSFHVTLSSILCKRYMATLAFLDENKITTTRTPYNIDASHYYGLEIGYSKNVRRWWYTNNSLIMSQESYKGNVKDLAISNKGMLSYTVNVDNNFFLSKMLALECDLTYESANRGVVNYNKDCFIMNMGAKYSVFNKRGSITLNFNNIFQSDKRYSTDTYNGLIQYWDMVFYTRAIRLNFTYRFGKEKATKIKSNSAASDERERTRM